MSLMLVAFATLVNVHATDAHRFMAIGDWGASYTPVNSCEARQHIGLADRQIRQWTFLLLILRHVGGVWSCSQPVRRISPDCCCASLR